MSTHHEKKQPVPLEGKALSLAPLVQYQDHSIVSREIYSKPIGNMTLFAFDADQGLSEHSAPFDALVYLLEGQATITLGGNPIPISAGELVLMPATIPHAVTAVSKFKMALIMFRATRP